MTINVKYRPTSTYELNEDGDFTCLHENAEVDRACCSGVDSDGLMSCGCGGMDSVYCDDCDNEDLTDSDVEAILEAYYEPTCY